MKTLALSIISVATLVACSPNAQLVTLRGNNVKPVADEGLVLENDTLLLRYNFASERGQMHLTLVNKLSQPLYVDWKRSSFIIGQDKVDYWQDVADVNLMASSYGSRYSRYSIGHLIGTISKDDQVGFIPPQTKIEKQQFVIVPDGAVQLKGMFKMEEEKSNWVNSKKPVKISVYNYQDADQSPLTFRNYLTLSTDKDFKTEFHIDTKFWASDVKVLPRDQILTRQVSGEYQYSVPVPFKKADSFYVVLPVQ